MARLDRADERDRRGHHAAAADRAAPSSRRCAIRSCSPTSSRRSTCSAKAGWSSSPPSAGTRDEYAALGVPFQQRGALLDEHLARLARVLAARRPRASGRALRVRATSTWSRSRTGPRARDCGSAAARPRPTAAPARRVRPRLPPVRPADPGGAAAADARWPPPGRDFAGRSSSSAASAPASRTRDRPGRPRRGGRADPRAGRAGYTAICFNPSQYTDDPRAVGAPVPRARVPRYIL